MKRNIYYLGIIVVSASLLWSCDDKTKEEEKDPILGTYLFGSATFNSVVNVKMSGVDIQLPAGFDASAFVGPNLVGAAPCDDALNAAIELKEDGTSFYSCLGEANEEQMGTWLINEDRSVLTLNISNPQPFSLTISGLDIDDDSFSGTVENFPLPKDASLALGASLPDGTVNYQVTSVDLTFLRVP